MMGLLVSGGLLILAGSTEDHLVEITLTTIAAYGAFLLAERCQMSGVTDGSSWPAIRGLTAASWGAGYRMAGSIAL